METGWFLTKGIRTWDGDLHRVRRAEYQRKRSEEAEKDEICDQVSVVEVAADCVPLVFQQTFHKRMSQKVFPLIVYLSAYES